MERGLINATNSRENFDGWVVGFYGEWSDKLTKLPETLADAQVVRWQSKYRREPTVQQRSWRLNKIRTDTAMMATKLNAQVTIKNLQNMHGKSLRPTGARRRMELAYQDLSVSVTTVALSYFDFCLPVRWTSISVPGTRHDGQYQPSAARGCHFSPRQLL